MSRSSYAPGSTTSGPPDATYATEADQTPNVRVPKAALRQKTPIEWNSRSAEPGGQRLEKRLYQIARACHRPTLSLLRPIGHGDHGGGADRQDRSGIRTHDPGEHVVAVRRSRCGAPNGSRRRSSDRDPAQIVRRRLPAPSALEPRAATDLQLDQRARQPLRQTESGRSADARMACPGNTSEQSSRRMGSSERRCRGLPANIRCSGDPRSDLKSLQTTPNSSALTYSTPISPVS